MRAAVFDVSPVLQKCGVVTTCDNKETVRNSRVVLVAVKPHVVARVLKDVSDEVTQDHVFISVAAGVTLATLGKVSRQEKEKGEDFVNISHN